MRKNCIVNLKFYVAVQNFLIISISLNIYSNIILGKFILVRFNMWCKVNSSKNHSFLPSNWNNFLSLGFYYLFYFTRTDALVYMCIYAPDLCSLTVEAKAGCWISWNWTPGPWI